MSEYLAMTTARTCSLTPVGGKGEITREMVAAACRALNNHSMLYALVKFSGSDGDWLNLVFAHELYIRDKAKLEGWQLKEKDTDEQMKLFCYEVLKESVNPPKCPYCGGRKVIMPSPKYGETESKLCKACNGTGRGKGMNPYRLSEILGCSWKRANSFWFPRYQEIISMMEALDSDIDYLIWRELNGD